MSRPGVKSAYAAAIAAIAGLQAGQRAGGYFWSEPEPGPRALMSCYPNPKKMREVSRILRGWNDESPRPLWDRLVASHRERPIPSDGDVAAADVASWLLQIRWSFSEMGPHKGWGGPGRPVETEKANWTTEQRDIAIGIPRLAGIVDGLVMEWPSVLITPAAGPPSGDMEGCVCYIDPPYAGTTPYLHDFGRAEVVALARAWDKAGALVLLSEAEPVDGWASGLEVIEITDTRRAQKRTRSKQQREFVTLNRVPMRWRLQAPLFEMRSYV